MYKERNKNEVYKNHKLHFLGLHHKNGLFYPHAQDTKEGVSWVHTQEYTVKEDQETESMKKHVAKESPLGGRWEKFAGRSGAGRGSHDEQKGG